MERVSGIGGFFFRSEDPKALARWYEEVLGVGGAPEAEGDQGWVQAAGETVFAPVDPDSEMPGSPERSWAINFRVDDFDAMVEQIRAAGTEVEVDPKHYSYGRFAWTADPEGNRIQLWQPE